MARRWEPCRERWAAIAYTLIERPNAAAPTFGNKGDLLERFQSARPSEFKNFLPDAWLKTKLSAQGGDPRHNPTMPIDHRPPHKRPGEIHVDNSS